MIIAQLHKIEYVCDPNKHTVAYAERCQGRASRSPDHPESIWPAIIVDDNDDAVTRLRLIVENYLLTFNFKPQPEDFRFWYRENIVVDSRFWLAGGFMRGPIQVVA